MGSNGHRAASIARRIGGATLVAAASLLLVRGTASAADVDLKNTVAYASGSDRLEIEDFGTCPGGVRLTVVFAEKGRKFVARDQYGTLYKGRYSQRGTDGRKLSFALSDHSRAKLRKAMEDRVRSCTGARQVESEIDRLVLTGKINRTLDALEVKCRLEGHGDTDLDDGDALYTFKVLGALVPVGP